MNNKILCCKSSNDIFEIRFYIRDEIIHERYSKRYVTRMKFNLTNEFDSAELADAKYKIDNFLSGEKITIDCETCRHRFLCYTSESDNKYYE